MITNKQDSHLKEVKRIVQDIEGQITEREAECLYWLARDNLSKGAIVEIGSYKGLSTVWLAKGSEAGNKSKVYAIDPHKDYNSNTETEPIFRENITRAGVSAITVPMIMKSEQAAKEWKGDTIKLLWIDGSHKYEDVKMDFLLWEPYIESGGTISFHDWQEDGPRKIIKKCIIKSSKFSRISMVERIAFARKVEKCCWSEKLLKRGLLLVMLLLDLTPFFEKHKTLSLVRKALSPVRRILIKLAARLM